MADPEQIVEGAAFEGRRRLERSWPDLIATGLVGGIDISVGLLALLVVLAETDNHLLSALAFGIGFIALVLARSELFTENFFVPVATVVAGRASVVQVLRLWGGTLVTNLLAGWLLTGLIVTALPSLRSVAVELGAHYPQLGISAESFALAILGGLVITLMTWMEQATGSMPARLIAVVAMGFLLAAGPLNHVVISALEMFAALHVGAPFGYADVTGAILWALLGNMLGGLVLVTGLRLMQAGRAGLQDAASNLDP
jgi:formate-nitrite transporter family protein